MTQKISDKIKEMKKIQVEAKILLEPKRSTNDQKQSCKKNKIAKWRRKRLKNIKTKYQKVKTRLSR